MLALVKGCVHLDYTAFPWGFSTDLVTDAVVMAVANTQPGLKHANFNGCRTMTDAAVVALADKCVLD